MALEKSVNCIDFDYELWYDMSIKCCVDSPFCKLMYDFKYKRTEELYYPLLASRVEMIKNTEEEVG